MRYLRDSHPTHCSRVICPCLRQYVAQGASRSPRVCHATPFGPDTPSSSSLRRSSYADQSSGNNLLNNHALYRLQYLTTYLIPDCSHSLARYRAARLLPTLPDRCGGDPRRRHIAHLGPWQQTTWALTDAEVVGAVPSKLARKIIFDIGVSPYRETSGITLARTLLSTRRPGDAQPRTTVAAVIPRKVRASGRKHVVQRPPVCVPRTKIGRAHV